ncbi:MAG: right-handed parallel beta-helix repeat-containing protein [Victivallaceae bacterium]|nr:right-handed parallel beta-helix repeat-containing protein [Victivallaceae bacterium]
MRFVTILLAVAASIPVFAESLVVDRNASSGKGVRTFATIGAAVAGMKPGDVITILPGEYNENLAIDGLGNAERTVIRAAMPGTVLMRGDFDQPAFGNLSGVRNVFRALYRRAACGVYERDSMSYYTQAATDEEMGNTRSRWRYSPLAQKLHVSTSDSVTPNDRTLSIAYERGSAITVRNAENLEISGIVFTGYHGRKSAGVEFVDSRNCTLSKCFSFNNDYGYKISSSSKVRVIDCEAEGNSTANYDFTGSSDCTMYGCRSFYACGVGIEGKVAVTSSLTYGNKVDFGKEVSFSGLKLDELLASTPEDVLFANFADPLRFDFRPLDGCRIPGVEKVRRVRFVAPGGSDSADGATPATAWMTLANARTGDSVYLLPGTYPDGMEIVQPDVEVIGRSGGAVIVADGKYGIVVKGRGDRVSNICFIGQKASGVSVRADFVHVDNCCFAVGDAQRMCAIDARNQKMLHVHNCSLDEKMQPLAPGVNGCSGACHSCIFYGRTNSPTDFFYDYNSMIDALIPDNAPHSVRRVPKFAAPGSGDFSLENADMFRGRGMLGRPLGWYRYEDCTHRRMVNLHVIRNLAKGAGVEWECSVPDMQFEFKYAFGRDATPDTVAPVISDDCTRRVVLNGIPAGVYSFAITEKKIGGRVRRPFSGVLPKHPQSNGRGRFMAR